MVEQGPGMGIGREASDDEEPEGIGLEAIRDIVGFVLRAARRRPVLTCMTFFLVASLGLAVAAIMPRTYSATVKMLAQRGSTIRVLSSPNQAMDSVDNPTKNVAAMITRRENLLALVREGNVVERHRMTRSPALKLKDKLFGTPSEEDMQLAMALTLEKRIEVDTDDTKVEITVNWPNAQLAYDLVTLVQKNFLEARYDSDVAMVTESITVLEDHARAELAHVDAELEGYQKTVAERVPKLAAPTPERAPTRSFAGSVPRPATGGAPSERPDGDVAKQLEEVRLHIRALEEGQQRAIDAARQQLTQAQLTLTPMHPTVIALQQQLDASSQPSPELADLRNQERALMAAIAPPSVSAPPSAAITASHLPTPFIKADRDAAADAPPATALLVPGGEHDGILQLAQSKLSMAIGAYEDAVVAVDRANVELDVTRAAYKHRYTVVTPAEVPRAPKKPTAKLIAVGAVFGGALLAFLVAAAADFAGGLVLESWQVRRRLKLEVLGELDIPQ
jgi:uncharacterized protein involved in exopolysaccharide biosynthesis